jgi:vacuolar-type H+-ATPase subunit H
LKRSGDRPSGPKPLAGSAARRVEAIVEGAERAAEKVIDEAEQQARAYLADAEADADRAVAERLAAVGELADALLKQADAIRRQAELLTESLRQAKGRLVGADSVPPETDQEPSALGERRAATSPGSPWRLESASAPETPPRAPQLTPVDSDQPVDPVPGERRGVAVDPPGGSPAGARLLATQMAVSGSSREEIASRLRSGFETEDADAILDAILGPES